jgi:hypothetical protein
MRRPDPTGLKYVLFLFLIVVPMGYFVVWWLLALIVAL